MHINAYSMKYSITHLLGFQLRYQIRIPAKLTTCPRNPAVVEMLSYRRAFRSTSRTYPEDFGILRHSSRATEERKAQGDSHSVTFRIQTDEFV